VSATLFCRPVKAPILTERPRGWRVRMPRREIMTTPRTTSNHGSSGPPATGLVFADPDKGQVGFSGIVDEHGVPVAAERSAASSGRGTVELAARLML